jgi:hypothetical protein
VSNNTCVCLPSFVWNSNSSTCTCQSGFTVNATKTCICNTTNSVLINGLCINCPLVTNSNGTDANNSACKCKSPYQWLWNTTTLTGSCICNATTSVNSNGSCINCSTLSYVTGAVSNNNCVCLTNFVWNSNSSKCICPNPFVLSASVCSCPIGYYQASNGSCVCNPTVSYILPTGTCFTCVNLPGSTGLR